jgi:hypothetical protein
MCQEALIDLVIIIYALYWSPYRLRTAPLAMPGIFIQLSYSSCFCIIKRIGIGTDIAIH